MALATLDLRLDDSERLDDVRHLLPESATSFTEAQIKILRQSISETTLSDKLKMRLCERFSYRLSVWKICTDSPPNVYILLTPDERQELYQFLLSHGLRVGIGRQLNKVRHRLVDT